MKAYGRKRLVMFEQRTCIRCGKEQQKQQRWGREEEEVGAGEDE